MCVVTNQHKIFFMFIVRLWYFIVEPDLFTETNQITWKPSKKSRRIIIMCLPHLLWAPTNYASTVLKFELNQIKRWSELHGLLLLPPLVSVNEHEISTFAEISVQAHGNHNGTQQHLYIVHNRLCSQKNLKTNIASNLWIDIIFSTWSTHFYTN